MIVKKAASSVYFCIPVGRPNCKGANMAANPLVCGVLKSVFRDDADVVLLFILRVQCNTVYLLAI